jgi:hypothetical protein
MKIFGSISRLVSVLFRKDGADITVRPNQSTTYSANRDVQIPPGDSDHVLVSADSTQTLSNKTISASSNTISNLANANIASGAAIDASKLGNGDVSNTELSYLDGVTSSIQTQFTGKQSVSEKGQANGYASLDSGGKVPVAQLPNSIMEYQGVWNASTNSPSLADGAGNADSAIGNVYRVSVAGSQNLGSGSISFDVGDYVILNASKVWEKADTTDAVSSVNGSTGAVVVNAINQLTGHVTAGPASGSQSVSSTIASGVITNTMISGSAAIDASKIADGSVSSTEFQYLNSVTSNVQDQLDGKQPLDSDLTAIAALSSTGIIVRTGSGSVATRSISAGAGISVTNGDGVAGNITIANTVTLSTFKATWSTADGTSKVVAHNLGSNDIMVQIWDNTSNEQILVDTQVRTDNNTLTLTASEAPASSWRVIVIAV